MPRIKRLFRLSLPDQPKTHHKRFVAPKPIEGDYIANLNDPRIEQVFARLGRHPKDYKLAQRIVTLQQKYPQGTIPELVTIDWLDQKRIPYTYQAWVYGGRSRRGGIVPDVVLEYAGVGMAWNVQGEYWHTRGDVAASDVADRLRLKGSWFEHVFIEKVVDLWEDDIYHKRPEIFDMALLGIGLRGEYAMV